MLKNYCDASIYLIFWKINKMRFLEDKGNFWLDDQCLHKTQVKLGKQTEDQQHLRPKLHILVAVHFLGQNFLYPI